LTLPITLSFYAETIKPWKKKNVPVLHARERKLAITGAIEGRFVWTKKNIRDVRNIWVVKHY